MKSTAVILSLLLSIAMCGCASQSIHAGAAGRDTARARELNDRAFKLIEQEKLAEAEHLLRDALTADPMFGPARNNLGLVLYHTDRLYEAAWEFDNAIRLMPFQPEPRNNLGLVLEKAGKLSGAADAYARARDMEPDNPEFLGNLARAKVRRGDHDLELRSLLEEVVMKDARPQWTDWARLSLFQLDTIDQRSTDLTTSPSTQP